MPPFTFQLITFQFSEVPQLATHVMGTNLSTSARSRKRLPMLPNAVNMSIASRASRCIESNPASTTGREIDRHLDAHTRFLRAIMKPKLFRRDSKGQKKSLEDYSAALARLDATLSKLFEALLKADRQMTFSDWKSKRKRVASLRNRPRLTET